MANAKPNISVVIPVYFAESNLNDLVEGLSPVLDKLADSFEIILVDDGSADRSWDLIRQLSVKHAFVRGFSLMRNYGQHNALLCGIRKARYEIIVTMDDDLQHPPEMIPRLLEELNKGYDVVYGFPAQEQHGIWRDLASVITKIALQTTMDAKTARYQSAFRAFRTRLRDSFSSYCGPYVSIDVLLTWGSAKFSYVEVEHHQRTRGESHYTFRSLLRHALNMMTGFSTLPLRISSAIGFVFTLFGIGVLFYVVIRYLIQGESVPGFPFLASIIAIFSGAQLFALGIMGEYLARMHFRLMDKPIYTIQASTDDGRD